jgi:gluconokinase
MLDKIRVHALGRLPTEYVENLGERPEKPTMFDARMCRFLRVPYTEIRDYVLANPSAGDAEILVWAEARAGAAGYTPRTDEECEIFNAFLTKRGWRDAGAGTLAQRIAESGFGGRTDVLTMCDYIDADEGRDPERMRAQG